MHRSCEHLSVLPSMVLHTGDADCCCILHARGMLERTHAYTFACMQVHSGDAEGRAAIAALQRQLPGSFPSTDSKTVQVDVCPDCKIVTLMCIQLLRNHLAGMKIIMHLPSLCVQPISYVSTRRPTSRLSTLLIPDVEHCVQPEYSLITHNHASIMHQPVLGLCLIFLPAGV